MRSRLCNNCGQWSPTRDWTEGCPCCGESNQAPRPGYQVMRDIKPYKSMITGELIGSRSKHREHLKQHGYVEVGNDSSLYRKPQPIKSPPGLKQTVIRAVNDWEKKQRRR